uniref:Kazal-like domain-containing protein n=1 Tax=Glossina palpalis gambiensis TaxID=67801 RepID=A0A1B0AW29_9MUSC
MTFSANLLLLGYFTLSVAKVVVVPTERPPNQCSFSCTDTERLLCAGNGQCMQQFKGECQISAYNCEHPEKVFIILDDFKCKQTGAPLCQQWELGHN